MTIYKGKEAVCGIQLTIDRWWRYAMTSEDLLTVKFEDADKQVITKTYTSSDINTIDKQIGVFLSETETNSMALGRGTFAAYLNDLVVIPPTEIFIEEAL